MEGTIIGVFGSDSQMKRAFETSLAKKSEAEGIVVYHRTDSGRRISLLDDSSFPERIQGYARVASLADYAFYVFPRSGKLAAPDGELAVLVESFALPGRVMIGDQTSTAEMAKAALGGTAAGQYPVEERSSSSTVLDLSEVEPRAGSPSGTLVYIDRAFSVKGVGTVALGFVVHGSVSVHDSLRPVPATAGSMADVKGIQINDEDFESSGRGIRLGLSLRGVEAKDLEKSHWLDDGTTQLTDQLRIDFRRSPFYKQSVVGRDLHIQLPGEMLTSAIAQGVSEGEITAKLPTQVPVWPGMRVAVIDLNGKNLRVAGGGSCKA